MFIFDCSNQNIKQLLNESGHQKIGIGIRSKLCTGSYLVLGTVLLILARKDIINQPNEIL
ncbi:hypothetical protein SAMN05421827_107139 [Pedobacter terrae]|uniref:Uncharacterized protein n=1 Tax=Pedobacter terrae TaxID=405671 RepID=A0A1G7UVN7_9SPHI|nr:hypothetical protein SAMN05421827_107139 [Pedobacter terrae]